MDSTILGIDYFNNTGINCIDQRRYQEAIDAFKKALRVGSNAVSYFLLGVSYQHLRQLDNALENYEEAIRINTKFTLALINVASICLEINKPEKAYSYLSLALEQDPNNAVIYANMGNYYKQIKKNKEAIENYQKSMQLNPKIPQNYFNLACIYFDEKKLDKAEDYFEKAIEAEPFYLDAYLHLGIVRKELGRLKDAKLTFEKYLEYNPNSEDTHTFLGNIYLMLGDIKEAKICYKKALDINPQFAAAYNELGNAYRYSADYKKAILNYKLSIKYNPDFSEAYHNYAVTLNETGKHEDAIKLGIKLLRKSLNLDSNASDTLAMLGFIYKGTCFFKESENVFTRLDVVTKSELAKGIKTGETPFINVIHCDDLQINLDVAKSWGEYSRKTMENVLSAFTFKKSENKKIRIGYFSRDFHDHATLHLMLGVFREHDKKKFEIYAYSYGKEDKSWYRKQLINYCDVFRDVASLSYVEAAKLINNDNIDILVDLKGYTSENKLEVCALRPAPIQVSYLGFPGTLGTNFIDYIITDKLISPEKEAKFYTEKLVYLPYSYQSTDNQQKIATDKFNRKMFKLPEKSFVFCSFCLSYKIDIKTIQSWVNILKKVKNSVLWLYETNSLEKKNIIDFIKKQGLDSGRIIFAQSLPKAQHLRRLQLADLALDTFLYNGHTTTSDALWAGVPVLTLKGKHFASRVSSSLLTAIGLPELITTTQQDYEDLAVSLATNPKKLNTIHYTLNANKKSAPLFDTKKFTNNLEDAYMQMFKNYQDDKTPKMITVYDK